MNAKFHCPLFRCLRFFLAYHRTYSSQYGGHKVLAMSTKLKMSPHFKFLMSYLLVFQLVIIIKQSRGTFVQNLDQK